MSTVLSLDRGIFLFLNTVFIHPALDVLFLVATEPRNWIAPLAVVCFLYFFRLQLTPLTLRIKPDWRKRLGTLLLLALTVSLTDMVGHRVLKPLFARPRPCHPQLYIEGGRFLLGYKHSLSFPSLHAMNMFGIAALLSWRHYRYRPWFWGAAFIAAYSRIYCGVHYPLDVLAGAVLGVAAGSAVHILARTALSRRKAGARSESRR